MVFVRNILIATLALSTIPMASCSLALKIAVFNNAGETVTAQPKKANVVIESGQSGEFRYPGDDENWELILAVKNCDYVYPVPRMLEDYPSQPDYRGPFKVQVEKDFVLYLLPDQATTIIDPRQLGSVQKGVFPLRPSSKACR